MKTKTFILLSLLICNLLPAQNVKLDIKPHFLGVRADSLFVSMDISVEIEDMNPKNAVILTPILTGQDRKILLPAIQLNGKQKQKLYVRNQILRKKKNSKESNTAYLVTGIDDENSRTIAYQTSLPAEQWMNDAALYLRRTIVRPESEQTLKDTLILAPQYAVLPPNVTATDIPAQEISATTMSTNSMPSISPTPVNKKLKYKGSYISPASDDVDIRNQKELNFNLEEAKIMADINPQMLSLRELYTVALSYADNKTKFYQIINISVKLYPVHPVANLNAAAAAIEQGDTKSASKFLSMALHEGLAYKSCRGVYELMTGNTYEGIRILKAAKAEGSEEAAYNLNVFFENNKRPKPADTMRYFITLLILFSCLDGYSQKVAVRLNALPATDGAFGAGVSYGIGNKSTVELAGSLRPWKRSEMYVNRYWLIQPEYKYWTCQKFNGFFWGGYLNGAQFNVGGKKLPFGIFADLKKYRYEGWLIGGGISCGYHWMLNDHWNVETSLGVGYDFIRYKQYNCVRKCAGLRNKGQYHYIGPSKASVSLVYLF